jgi:hypothetical protein
MSLTLYVRVITRRNKMADKAEKYYSTDLSISIVEIKAKNKKQAEEFMNQFIDKIAPIMSDQIRWNECDWEIEENVLDKAKGIWIKK